MAIVLDINFLCNNMLDISIIENLLIEYQVKVDTINCLDNWMWDNEKEVESLNGIEKMLMNNQIVVIKLKRPLIKDLGMYIEKIENIYQYTLWINTEGYPELDCDMINEKNRRIYEKILQAILCMKEKDLNIFEIIGIGLETDIHYSKKIIDIIKNSENILVWIINRHVELSNDVDGYVVKHVKGIEILERKKA